MSVSHPTILIGYGSYGQTVLRRLLDHAASRGTLAWEDVMTSGAGAAPGTGLGAGDPVSKRLKNLSLMCIEKDRSEDNLFSNDLQRQIQAIWPSEQDRESQNPHLFIKAELTKAVRKAKDELLSAARRANDVGRLRLGLDVIVVANVSGVDVLGALEDYLQPAMAVLANDAALRQGQDLLNFTLLMDFEHYWDESPEGRILRTETSKFVERWQERQRRREPGFGRIYVGDGESQNGYRNWEARIDETSLFLELALFEGLRDEAGLRRMFQSVPGSGVLAGFGIRVIEDNRGLLSKLAAARFGCGLLEYLGQSAVPGDAEGLGRFARALDPYRPEILAEAAPKEELAKHLSEGLQRIENGLLRIPLGENWVKDVQDALEAGRLRVKTDLANWAGGRMQEIAGEQLLGLREELARIISSALHDDIAPLPLGAVLDELKELQGKLEKASLAPRFEEPSADPSPNALQEAYQQFQEYNSSQVNVEGTQSWWPLLGLALAAVWTPIVMDATDEFLSSQGESSWASQALGPAAPYLDKSTLLIPLCVVLVWWLGYRLISPWLKRRIARGRQLLVHPERGLLSDRLWAAVRSGSFRHAMEDYAANLMHEMVQRLRSEVWWEVSRAKDLLTTRSREMNWLKMSLRDFQKGNGLSPDGAVLLDQGRMKTASCRFAMEGSDDLRRMLRDIPARPERFRPAQAEQPRFLGWNNRYCSAFLDPLPFLEDLSKQYEQLPAIWSLSGPDEREMRAKKLTKLIQEKGIFHAGMQWTAPTGEAPSSPELFCVLPPAWRDLPNVRGELDANGFTENHLIPATSTDRAYLLQVQLDLGPARLREEEKRGSA